jgi:hypothetical protein
MSNQDPEQNSPADYENRSWMKPRRLTVRKKKPPLNTLTPQEYEARLNKILLAALGKAWMFWPTRAEVKRRCAVPGKPGWWKCEDPTCGRETEKIEIDHIEPCVKFEGKTTWDEYITRRFVFDAKLLQGLCHESHLKKTKEENAKRREQRKWGSTSTKKGSA